jgi:DNA-binding NarL/FixJ family response regulator
VIRIVIGEDHAIVRSGLRRTLALEPDLEVVGEARDGPTLLEVVGATLPDVVMTDMSMPDLSGLELVKALRSAYPTLPVLVLSMHDHVEIVARTLRAGASGYVSKDSDPAVLAMALRRTAAGDRFVAPELAQRMVLRRAVQEQPVEDVAMSDREYQVLEGIARGVGAAELAAELGVSTKTVSAHKMRLMRKLGYTSTSQLLRFALDRGIGAE